MKADSTIEPVRKSVELACGPADAFRLFTDDIDSWWPLATHSVGEADAVACFFEARDGGRIYETCKDGTIHLWGTVTGTNPYWAKFDWNLALQDGSAYSRTLSTAPYGGPQYYNDTYEFADTVMLLKVDHEVAPKEMAYGRTNNGCADCHFSGQIDWSALGWTGDPTQGGTQTLP